MKPYRILFLALLMAAGAAAGVSAEGVSIELGGLLYDFNSLSSQQGAAGTATNVFNITPDPYVNGSYTMKFSDELKLKLGLMAEDIMGTNPGFVMIARGEPYAELAYGALTVRASLPLYLLSYDTTNDPKFKEIGYILDKTYKGIHLSTVYGTTNTFLVTNFESLSYKLALDKTLALVFAASTEIGLSPALWMYDVKPQVSLIWGPVQLDVKESIYFADAVSAPSFTDSKFATRYYTSPKLTFNFSDLGVKGLKVFLAADLFTANVPYVGTVDFYGTGKAKGSNIIPGVSFAMGPFSAEADFKYSNYDKTYAVDGADPTFDPCIKLSYTLAF